MPKKDFPRDLRGLPEPAAREIYIHRAVRKRFARIFFEEYEDGQKAGRTVAFRFSDVIYFLAVSASQGILGNVAYDALKEAVHRIRKPSQERGAGRIKFEAVISRRTYNRVRRRKHPRNRASRGSSEVERKLEKEYGLMVTIKRSER